MVHISPAALGEMGQRILINMSKYIVDKEPATEATASFLHGPFALLSDEPHFDQDIGVDARVKVR